MPRWGRNRYGYRKNKSFSRGRGGYGGYSRGSRYSQAPSYQRDQADVNIVVGRKRIWIFNNTDDIVAIMPGQYIVLEITREGDNQLGHYFRTAILGDGKAETQTQRQEAPPEERPQDWV